MIGAMRGWWTRFANRAVRLTGSLPAFAAVSFVVLLWIVSGPLFGFSDAWLILGGTATSVVTFVLVFVIQYSHNRDTRAVHLKLDELLRALGETRTELVRLEHRTDEELDAIEGEFHALRKTQQAEAGTSGPC